MRRITLAAAYFSVLEVKNLYIRLKVVVLQTLGMNKLLLFIPNAILFTQARSACHVIYPAPNAILFMPYYLCHINDIIHPSTSTCRTVVQKRRHEAPLAVNCGDAISARSPCAPATATSRDFASTEHINE